MLKLKLEIEKYDNLNRHCYNGKIEIWVNGENKLSMQEKRIDKINKD